MTVEIIDTHQHLWDLDKLSLPWVDSIESLNRSYLLTDYHRMNAANQDAEFAYEIVSSLYMEVDVAETDIIRETELLLGSCRDPATNLTGMIAATRPGTSLFPKTLALAEANPEIRGFRRVLHVDETPTGFCLQPEFVRDLNELGEHGLAFDVCIRRPELGDVCRLAEACPRTQFVLDHCGNADVRLSKSDFDEWARDIRSIGNCENVVCKVSGFVWTIQNEEWTYEQEIEPFLQVVCEAFGEDRLLFGGDWPVCTLSVLSFQQWLNSLYRFFHARGDAETRKLFSENAQRVYRL